MSFSSTMQNPPPSVPAESSQGSQPEVCLNRKTKNPDEQNVGPIHVEKSRRKRLYRNRNIEAHNRNDSVTNHDSDPKPQPRIDRFVLSEHERQIMDLRSTIEQLASKNVLGSYGQDEAELEKAICIQRTHESKLAELEVQLAVYKTLKERAITNYKSKPKELAAQLHRELYRFQNQLPIFAKRLEIEDYVEHFDQKCRFLIIQGETGSGKSTQLPQYFADHPRFQRKKILCVQPRKIAAISLANRVTFEYYCGDYNARPGYVIGYHVAGGKKTSSETRIEFITEGKMLENIISGTSDPFENVGAIILDEAHERSINCDVLLGCFKMEDPRWNDIMIVVTSATINLDQFSDFFNKAPAIVVPGRTFPVSINYRPCPGFGFFDNTQEFLKACIQCTLDIHMSSRLTPGDILCFLPGQADVLAALDMFNSEYRRACSKIQQSNVHQLLEPIILPLYSRLEPEQQARVFEQFGNQSRKIIFATDIAETSVTIEGVVHVVDSGVKKGITYDPKRKISSLRLQPISKSSAIQRMGRAGRTKPGECYRLYTPEDFEDMELGRNPEILARPLALTILTLRKMKMDPLTFPWISQPPNDALESAEEELLLLKALVYSRSVEDDTDEDNAVELTELGHLISTVQQEPSLVKMIQYGCGNGLGEAAVTLVSIFSVSSTFYYSGSDPESKSKSLEKRKSLALVEGDVVSQFRTFEEWTRISKDNPNKVGIWCRDNFVNGKSMKIIVSTRNELRMYFRHTTAWKATEQTNSPSDEELSRIAFAGLFLNTCHIMKTRQSHGKVQYYSLWKGVPGFCSRDSALCQHPNPPDWIAYDRVLQVPVTLFLTCNKVLEDWIREEDATFYYQCKEMSLQLPTSISRQLSPELVSTLVGKFYSKIRFLENELSSTVETDLDSGMITLFFPKCDKDEVERKLDTKVKSVLQQLSEGVIEQEYLGGCRLLVGEGFHVKDVLFSDDFVSIFLRNLPPSTTEDDIKDLVRSQRLPCSDNRIHNVQIFRGGNPGSGSALITFYSKQYAQQFHQKCFSQQVILNGQPVASNPALGKRKGVSAEITGKLKYSWPLGPSEQKAKLWFKSGVDANTFIDRANIFLSGAGVHAVSSQSNQNHPLPSFSKKQKSRNNIPAPTIKMHAVRRAKAANYRFDMTKIMNLAENEQKQLEYTVTVDNIQPNMDEYAIMESLRHLNLVAVRVFRRPSEILPIRDELLAPVAELVKTHPSHLFNEELGRRTGVWISFTRLGLLREAYSDIVSSPEWRDIQKPFGQTPRLEIEYYYTATVLVELYLVLEKEFQEVMKYGQSIGVHIQHPLPSKQLEMNQMKQQKSKFIHIRFHSSTELNFPEIKKRMEKVTECQKFQSDSIELFFNSTGRAILNRFEFKRYLFPSFHSKTIWIYGEEQLRQKIAERLEGQLSKLKSLEYLDHQLSINKKGVNNNRDRGNLHRLCTKAGLEYWEIRGSKIMVSGSKENVEKLNHQLEKNKLIFTHKPRRSFVSTSDCGLCFDQPQDRKYAITTNCLNGTKNCERMFCQECIQPMFEQLPPPFPLKCPSCETLLLIGDIIKWAPPSALNKVLEVAIQDFKENNSHAILSCPKPGCEQVLDASLLKKGHYGGSFIFCDECITTYCLDCSKKMDKAVEMHEDATCEEFQNGSPNRAYIHVNFIRENILNLRCPKCSTAFLDFEGCGALACECGCHFCALCLQDCGADAHPHVANCKWNSKRDLYVNIQDLSKAHRETRITKIRERLSSVTAEERKRVLNILCKDLVDLGINLSDI